MYFSNSIFFWWISVISLNYISYIFSDPYIIKVIILKVIISTAKGMAQALQKFYFILFIFFFWKNRTSLSNTPRYSFYLFDIHITMIQLLISLKFPTHPFRDIYRCSRQKDVWIFGSTCPLAFWKKSHSENFKKLPCKTSMLESFLSILGSFTNSCSEQL